MTIDRALSFLATTQDANGSYISLSSPTPDDFAHATSYRSLFPAALILNSLSALPQPVAINIAEKLGTFLLQQRSEHWSYNYWQRGSAESKTKPYPDDLDDTFCALAALMKHNANLFNGEVMARIVNILTLVEQQEGGPYKTWLVPPSADAHWQDIDLAVNSNIAYFLRLHDIHLPNIDAFLESAINTTSFVSQYYPSQYPLLYFIARSYDGPKKTALKVHIRSQQVSNGSWGNPLHTALAMTALLLTGEDVNVLASAVKYLRDQQLPDGSWPAHAFCLDPAIDGKPQYAGSPALTTAFCIEALSKYAQAIKDRRKTNQTSLLAQEQMFSDIQSQVLARCTSLEHDLQAVVTRTIHATLTKDTARQIPLLAYHTRSALGERAADIPDTLVATLGQANVFGWMAYTIYDDFLDGEGTPVLLPAATLFARQANILFSSCLPTDSGFNTFVDTIFDTIDMANAWEVNHCHLPQKKLRHITANIVPDYGNLEQLAHKSIGHATGPAALLISLGYDRKSPEVTALIAAFKHFIIARQLNDDAHDWQEDIQKGYVNAVTAILLNQFLASKATLSLNVTDEQVLAELQEFFWKTTVLTVCEHIQEHARRAKDILNTHPTIRDSAPITQFIDPIEATVQETINKRAQTLSFIRTYTA